MGIFSFLQSKKSPRKEEPEWVEKNALARSITSVTTGGLAPRRGDKQLLQAYRDVPAIFSVVKKVSDNAASTPFILYRRKGADGRTLAPGTLKSYTGERLRKEIFQELRDRDDLEKVEEHPMLDLLHSPNNLMSGRTLLWLTYAWIDVVGEAFWILERSKLGIPVRAYPVPTHWVLKFPKGEDHFIVNIGERSVQVERQDMVWFRHPDLENPYSRGTGAGQATSDDVDIDEHAVQHVNAFFHNQAVPPLIVSVDQADEATLKQAKVNWEKENRGFRQAYRTAWISGSVSVERLDTSFADLGLVELRKYSRDNILQTWGISPEMLGILDDSNRATVSEARFLFAENVIVPRIDLVRSTLDQDLVPQYDDRIILGYDNPIPDDNEFRLKVMKTQPGAFTVNEWRRLAAYPDHDQGSMFMVPTDIAVVTEDLSEVTFEEESFEEEDDFEEEERGAVLRCLS